MGGFFPRPAKQEGEVLQQGRNTAKEQRTLVEKTEEEMEKVNKVVSISIVPTESW